MCPLLMIMSPWTPAQCKWTHDIDPDIKLNFLTQLASAHISPAPSCCAFSAAQRKQPEAAYTLHNVASTVQPQCRQCKVTMPHFCPKWHQQARKDIVCHMWPSGGTTAHGQQPLKATQCPVTSRTTKAACRRACYLCCHAHAAGSAGSHNVPLLLHRVCDTRQGICGT
jgi:hypothetical protein